MNPSMAAGANSAQHFRHIVISFFLATHSANLKNKIYSHSAHTFGIGAFSKNIFARGYGQGVFCESRSRCSDHHRVWQAMDFAFGIFIIFVPLFTRPRPRNVSSMNRFHFIISDPGFLFCICLLFLSNIPVVKLTSMGMAH